MAAIISLTKTDGWCQPSLRPSLVHFPESRSPSSRGSRFTADSQLTKQGELLRPHFRALFIGSTINAMCKHLHGGQGSPGASLSILHLNIWKEFWIPLMWQPAGTAHIFSGGCNGGMRVFPGMSDF